MISTRPFVVILASVIQPLLAVGAPLPPRPIELTADTTLVATFTIPGDFYGIPLIPPLYPRVGGELQ